MKHYFYVLLASFCISAPSWSVENSSYDKFYVASDSILIGENGIFAKIEGQIIQSNAILSDENGIYIPYDEIVTWICQNGHYVRPSEGNVCPKCGGKNRKD